MTRPQTATARVIPLELGNSSSNVELCLALFSRRKLKKKDQTESRPCDTQICVCGHEEVIFGLHVHLLTQGQREEIPEERIPEDGILAKSHKMKDV